MAEEWCDHCDLPRPTCIHGRPPREDLPVKTGPTIEATQTTRCGHCSKMLEPGQSITMSDEGWVHTSDLGDRSWPGDMSDVSARPQTDPDLFEGID